MSCMLRALSSCDVMLSFMSRIRRLSCAARLAHAPLRVFDLVLMHPPLSDLVRMYHASNHAPLSVFDLVLMYHASNHNNLWLCMGKHADMACNECRHGMQ